MPPKAIYIKDVVLASHLVFMGYGHWLPNDPRGSGSTHIAKPELRDLGPIHFGRKEDQPTRDELRKFFRAAEPLLNHDVVWFNAEMRDAVACAFADVIKQRGYTVWAFAILRNHAHAVVRTHKSDDSETMWHLCAEATAYALHAFPAFSPEHPVWSGRPYKVYLKSRPSVRTRVGYVERNPEKEGLPRQTWEFVTRCPWI
jgi:REP element-mobilizing transposase RayT